MMFSPPGLFIIEILGIEQIVTPSYRKTAHILGHHWHGLESTTEEQGNVQDVNELSVDFAVRKLLKVWQANSR